MRVLHADADAVDERQDDERGDGVADEGGDDEDQAREDEQHGVQAEALDADGDLARDGVQEARAVDGLAEREAAGGQDDDGPQEVVEVLLGEDAGAEEQDDRDDGDHAHVAEDVLELVAHAPQHDGGERHERDEPLHAREAVLDGAHGDDRRALAGLEADEEEDPDYQDGDDADGDGDEEPGRP